MAGTMGRTSDKILTVRVPDIEMERLDTYCAQTKRTKTDVIRELIRRLPIKEK
jgi:predicted DNA-binding protein